MPIQITNTLSGKKEAFVPLKSNKVGMYVCGPTVYGFTHVGNARPVVFFDVVRRFLEFSGYSVTYVSNITDVDDRIIQRAREENSNSFRVADQYTVEFIKDMESLKVRKPDRSPRVTDHIAPIIALIEGLVKKSVAYLTADGSVFFSVRSFPAYGKLSRKNVDELLAGTRVEVGEYKQDPLDFALWKAQKNSDEPAWASPWGMGRPGWHIECSAMSTQYLGESFDIHGGGIDLVHPHHENEIAQAEALTGRVFVKYWMHNNLVNIESTKMSKSLGNIFLTRDFIGKFGAETLKFLLLSGHYRSPIDFSQIHIRECQSALHRIYVTVRKCEELVKQTSAKGVASPEEATVETLNGVFEGQWRQCMEDDFNTAKVVGQVFDYVRSINTYLDRRGFLPTDKTQGILRSFLANVKRLSGVLNIFGEPSGPMLDQLRDLIIQDKNLSRKEIEAQIALRTEARKRKDFNSADAIRDTLVKQGIELQDTPNGTTWDVIFQE